MGGGLLAIPGDSQPNIAASLKGWRRGSKPSARPATKSYDPLRFAIGVNGSTPFGGLISNVVLALGKENRTLGVGHQPAMLPPFGPVDEPTNSFNTKLVEMLQPISIPVFF